VGDYCLRVPDGVEALRRRIRLGLRGRGGRVLSLWLVPKGGNEKRVRLSIIGRCRMLRGIQDRTDEMIMIIIDTLADGVTFL
jgi:hypothetical protein